MAADVLAGSRPSTVRQYQSAWKALQGFLRNRPVTSVSLPIIFDFLSYMFHARNRAPQTISTYAAALADPLWFGFHLDVRSRVWDLMKRSFFIHRPPPRRPTIFWSLSKVLASLEGPTYAVAPDLHHRLRKALFLVAMASGLRSSQLHALTRHPAWLVFAPDGQRVSLAPSPKFLAKNEREGHVLTPYHHPGVDGRPLSPSSLPGGCSAGVCFRLVSPLSFSPLSLAGHTQASLQDPYFEGAVHHHRGGGPR